MIAVNRYQTVNIGEAARLTGASVNQIRYFAEQGLIPAPDRVVCGEGSYRQYSPADLDKDHTLQAAARMAQAERRKQP
ncbi:MAG: MerR family transcriptional regulator [Desulfobacterales bacterium]|nr:MerR family transcriptional regulator [Desulfobacterales bacterium]